MLRAMASRVVTLLALILTVLTLPWVVWLYLPAPTLALWAVAALLNEVSLLLAFAALLVVVLSLVGRRLGARRLPLMTGITGSVMLLGALLPTLNAYRAAGARGVLSFSGYFAGLAISAERDPQTETYLVLEGQPLHLDIWQPLSTSENPDGPRPAVVMVHGGSWNAGARSEAPRWNTWLNDQALNDQGLNDEGVVVVDIDYRLAPPARWRGATGDVKCAVGWVKRHAATLGVDPNRIVLMGNSAGAHLALLAAYTAGDARLPASCPVTDSSVAGVVALSPPTDLQWLFEQEFPWWYPEALAGTGSLEVFTGGTPAAVPEAYRLGSPINHVRQNLPPTLLIHGQNDQFVFPEETDRLAARLLEAGAPHQVLKLPDANHLFAFVWGSWGSQRTRAVLAEFLAEVVRGN